LSNAQYVKEKEIFTKHTNTNKIMGVSVNATVVFGVIVEAVEETEEVTCYNQSSGEPYTKQEATGVSNWKCNGVALCEGYDRVDLEEGIYMEEFTSGESGFVVFGYKLTQSDDIMYGGEALPFSVGDIPQSVKDFFTSKGLQGEVYLVTYCG